VAERLAARHLLVRLDRRPDDVRVAVVHRIEVGHGEVGHGEVGRRAEEAGAGP